MAFSSNIPVIYLAFANDSDKHLPILEGEAKAILSHFQPLVEEGHIVVELEEAANFENVAERLNRLRDRMVVFHLASHAANATLNPFDPSNGTNEIIQLLGYCTNLRLVVLSGGGDLSIVNSILEAGVPAVLATQSPVQDKLSSQYAEYFYRNLAQGYTLNECFKQANTPFSSLQKAIEPVIYQRPIQLTESANFPWGLYIQNVSILRWRLRLGSAIPLPLVDPSSALMLSPFLINNHYFNRNEPVDSLYQFSHYEENEQIIHYKGLAEGKTLSIGPNAGIYQPIWRRFQTFWKDLTAEPATAETVSPTVPHPLLTYLGRTEQVEQFAVAIRNPNLPYQVSLLPAPPKSAPNHALLQLKSSFEEVIKDNYFVFDTVSFAAKEGLEGVKRHLFNMLKKWRDQKTPPSTASVLALIHFEGDWYGHRTGLINWLQSEAEKLFDLPFKQTIVAIALDLPEAPNTGSFQKVFRRNNADEQVGWLRNVAKSFDAITLLPSLGKLSWEDINSWLTRNEAELRHLFPEWPAGDFLRKQLGEAKEGYDMEVVLGVLENSLKSPNSSAR